MVVSTKSLLAGCVLVLAAGCGERGPVIAVDGSSTVFPLTEAVAEAYKATGTSRVTVGVSGTGGGFKKLCNGEVSITGASRPIRPPEVQACAARGVAFVELPVAYDGIAIVVHPENTWVDHLTVDELKRMWQPQAQGTVERWSDVRPGWPARELHLFGPGVDSGTYDYFTAAVVGQEHASRGDFTSSEDDNVLVQGVSSDIDALGLFGLAYYLENADKLKLVPVDDGDPSNGAGPIAPSPDTVADGTYQPLSRPIFLYVALDDAASPTVARFVDFYLDRAPELAESVGYVALPEEASRLVRRRFADRTPGSLFGGAGSRVGVTVEDLLRAG